MKNKLLRGTIILTTAGFLSRLLGFFYKIYLAGAMSEERMGLYQLLFPVYGICFTLYASGIQTAISKRVAEANALCVEFLHKPRTSAGCILRSGLLLSLPLSLLLTALVYFGADFLALHVLHAPATAPSLRILSFMFPFCSITACLNGYFYGAKYAGIPAGTQLLEQVVRISFVMLCGILAPTLFPDINGELSCERAAAGIAVGEIASCIVSLGCLLLTVRNRQACKSQTSGLSKRTVFEPSNTTANNTSSASVVHSANRFHLILQIALPLTANHLVLSLLHSYETILLPELLGRGGLNHSHALGTLGIVNGMVMPFILFPTAITGALAILLLPTISEIYISGRKVLLQVTIRTTLRATFLLGILTSGLFLCFGKSLCELFFRNQHAGTCLRQFALLCPILYATQTTGSILNGLTKTNLTFRNSVVSCIVRLLLQVILIPKMLLTGYLLASFSGTLLQLLMDLWALRKEGLLRFDVRNSIVRPFLVTLLLLPIFTPLNAILGGRSLHSFALLAAFGGCYCVLFFFLQGILRKR